MKKIFTMLMMLSLALTAMAQVALQQVATFDEMQYVMSAPGVYRNPAWNTNGFHECDWYSGSLMFTTSVNGTAIAGAVICNDLLDKYDANNSESAFRSAAGGAHSEPNFLTMYEGTMANLRSINMTVWPDSTYSETDLVTIPGMWMTNAAITVAAIRGEYSGPDGARAFGADDWMKVRITGYDADYEQTNYLEVDLAKGTWVLEDWIWVDLSVLGPVAHISFRMFSSDPDPTYPYNCHTPMYYCIDDLGASNPTPVANIEANTQVRKQIENGKVVIIRGEKRYSVIGQEM